MSGMLKWGQALLPEGTKKPGGGAGLKLEWVAASALSDSLAGQGVLK